MRRVAAVRSANADRMGSIDDDGRREHGDERRAVFVDRLPIGGGQLRLGINDDHAVHRQEHNAGGSTR